MGWSADIDWKTAKKRAEIINSIRRFFEERDVVEVETPLMSNGTITDVYIDTFITKYTNGMCELANKDLYLQTSPEFAMKRLLSSGYGSIYQICKAFRNEGNGTHHNPEFTMLEWYRVDFDHFDLMDEVQELLVTVLGVSKVKRFTYQAIFMKFLELDPLDCNLNELKGSLSNNNILGDWISKEQNKDTLLQMLFTEVIERQIGISEPCFIYNFPASQASLAKISTTDKRVAERFECYYKGIELANGFHELTDAVEQERRFEKDNEMRRSLGKEIKIIDNNFIQALHSGLPECAGVALGIDRLLMLALDAISIKETSSFNITNA